MSRDIEADYIEDCHNEEKSCPHCNSYTIQDGGGFCNELDQKVPPTAHCDFFRESD